MKVTTNLKAGLISKKTAPSPIIPATPSSQPETKREGWQMPESAA